MRESIANCKSTSVVLLNEFYSTDLKITSNGEPLSTFRVNGDMTGFKLNKGKHILKIDMQPSIMWHSYMISSILILFCIVLGLIRFAKARNQNQFRN